MQFVRPRRSFLSFLAILAIGAAVGYLRAVSTDEQWVDAIFIGMAIPGLITLFEQFFVRQPWGAWLRRSPLIIFVVVSGVVWMGVIAASLYLIPTLLGAPTGWFDKRLTDGSFAMDLVFAAVAVFILNTLLRLRSLVGGRILTNFLSGHYRNPIEEDRIFLFLDLIGSTVIAERLGPVKYHAFLRDFIEAIEMRVSDFGGEIYQYVGDEVVATWPVRNSRANGRAVGCHYAMIRSIARRRAYFEKKYGEIPRFGGGIHCGEVVAGEIGDQRRQIVFVGDAVNTAARIEAQAKANERSLLVSGVYLSRTELPANIRADALGKIALKGKAEPVELFELVNTKQLNM
jgi:adenylate cyclase